MNSVRNGYLTVLQNPFPISPTTEYMANYLYQIDNHCARDVSQDINGQQFDSDHYNVYVHDPCASCGRDLCNN